MATLHVFASLGRFKSWGELRAYIDPDYTEDGDQIDSPFITEVGLSDIEPGCIEAVHSDRPVPLTELIGRCSYSEQWLRDVSDSGLVTDAICVYETNVTQHPHG